MRITSGVLGGRTIKVPKAGVRPTQERVREALFSSIGEAIRGSRVLDLFAGSGALGLEAWSRGADHVCWIEQDSRTFHALQTNVRTLCGDAAAGHCVRADVFAFLKRCRDTYDFILADPPYEGHTSVFDTERFLEMISLQGCLNPDGRLVLEQRSTQTVHTHPRWEIGKNKTYGETRILFYVPLPHK